MKNLNSLDRSNCIKVLISPDKNGFVCAIEEEINNNLKDEEKELVQTIARGLIFQAQKDPHATFMMGVKGFSLDKQNGDKKLKVTKQKKHEENKNDNVIDFLEHLKKKKDEEQFEEEIQDPF